MQAELKACQELEARKAMHDATFKQRQCASLPRAPPHPFLMRGLPSRRRSRVEEAKAKPTRLRGEGPCRGAKRRSPLLLGGEEVRSLDSLLLLCNQSALQDVRGRLTVRETVQSPGVKRPAEGAQATSSASTLSHSLQLGQRTRGTLM